MQQINSLRRAFGVLSGVLMEEVGMSTVYLYIFSFLLIALAEDIRAVVNDHMKVKLHACLKVFQKQFSS